MKFDVINILKYADLVSKLQFIFINNIIINKNNNNIICDLSAFYEFTNLVV